MSSLRHGTTTRTTDTSRYLNFALGEEQYTLPLLAVQEVIAIPAITPLPGSPSYFLGIMNLRGRIISIVDLSLKLNSKSAVNRSAESAVIILDLGNSLSVGILVSSVNSVLSVQSSNISPAPETGDGRKLNFLNGVAKVGERMYLMLDTAKLFQMDTAHIEQRSETAPTSQAVAA